MYSPTAVAQRRAGRSATSCFLACCMAWSLTSCGSAHQFAESLGGALDAAANSAAPIATDSLSEAHPSFRPAAELDAADLILDMDTVPQGWLATPIDVTPVADSITTTPERCHTLLHTVTESASWMVLPPRTDASQTIMTVLSRSYIVMRISMREEVRAQLDTSVAGCEHPVQRFHAYDTDMEMNYAVVEIPLTPSELHPAVSRAQAARNTHMSSSIDGFLQEVPEENRAEFTMVVAEVNDWVIQAAAAKGTPEEDWKAIVGLQAEHIAEATAL